MNKIQIADLKKEYERKFIIERLTYIHISEENEKTYIATPEDLKGGGASEKLWQWFESKLNGVEHQSSFREEVEEMKDWYITMLGRERGQRWFDIWFEKRIQNEV